MKNVLKIIKRRGKFRCMHLDGSAVCGGEERKRESEESFNHKNILFP